MIPLLTIFVLLVPGALIFYLVTYVREKIRKSKVKPGTFWYAKKKSGNPFNGANPAANVEIIEVLNDYVRFKNCASNRIDSDHIKLFYSTHVLIKPIEDENVKETE